MSHKEFHKALNPLPAQSIAHCYSFGMTVSETVQHLRTQGVYVAHSTVARHFNAIKDLEYLASVNREQLK